MANSKQSIEEAAKEYADSTNINFIDHTYCIKDFKAGAAWQLEQFKAQEQKPVTDEEIEKFGEKEYPILWKDMSQHKHEIFIKGFKAALKKQC